MVCRKFQILQDPWWKLADGSGGGPKIVGHGAQKPREFILVRPPRIRGKFGFAITQLADPDPCHAIRNLMLQFG